MTAAAYYNDLNAALSHAWAELASAVQDRKHGFRIIQLATVDRDGSPNVRSVVLRAVATEQRCLQFHTDSASHKLIEVQHQPRVALHAYDARQKLQLRLYGEARLHQHDSVAEAAWNAAHDMSRICYRSQPPSGARLDRPLDITFASGSATDDPGYTRFVVVQVVIDTLEWLYLAAAGYRRARWQHDGQRWLGQWLAP